VQHNPDRLFELALDGLVLALANQLSDNEPIRER
jgi:hypothetical protein